MPDRADLYALVARLGLDRTEYDRGAKEVNKSTRRLSRSFNTAGNAVRNLEKQVIGAFAAIAGAVGLVKFNSAIRETIANFDELQKTARSVGVATEELSGLSFVAEQGGQSFNDLQKTLVRLSRTLSNEARGLTDESAKALRRLEIAATDSAGNVRGTFEVFLEIADIFSELEDGPTKTAAAFDLLGKAGVSAISSLNQGSEGIRALLEEAERLGLVIDEVSAALAEEFNDNLNVAAKTVQGAFNSIAKGLLPALVTLQREFLEGGLELEKFTEFGRRLGEVLNSLVGAVQLAIAPFRSFFATLQAAGRSIGTLVAAIENLEFDGFGDAISAIGDQLVADLNAINEDAREGVDRIFDSFSGRFAERAQETFEDVRDNLDIIPDLNVAVDIELRGNEELQRQAARAAREAAQAAAQAAREVQQEVDALVDASRTPVENYNLQLARISQLFEEGRISAETFSRSVDRLNKELADTSGLTAMQDEAQALIDDLKTTEEQFTDFQKRVDTLRTERLLSDEQAAAILSKRYNETVLQASESAQFIESSFTTAGNAFADALLDSEKTARDSFRFTIDSILRDLSRLVLSSAFKEVQQLLFGTPQSTSSSGGGFLSSLFGSFLNAGLSYVTGSLFGGAGTTTVAASDIGGLTGALTSPAGVFGGSSVNITNNGPPVTVDQAAFLSDGDINLVISAASAQTEQNYTTSVRSGYGSFSTVLNESTLTRRRV